MRALGRRVAALELASPPDVNWRPFLAALCDDDLDRLVDILKRRDAGTPIEAMSDDDLRFLASIGLAGDDESHERA